jgi:hypothetical protein
LASFPKVGSTLVNEKGEPTWQMSAHWHETGDQKAGTIKRKTGFRPVQEMVIQGPHFHVGNPLYKTPRRICNSKGAYDCIDLVHAPEDYLPRTNFGSALSTDEYRQRMTKSLWASDKSHGDFYRVAMRSMIALNSERSLIGALIPPGVLHIHNTESVAVKDVNHLLELLTFVVSLPLDFFIKASGRGGLFTSVVSSFPFTSLKKQAIARSVRLSCITKYYEVLWNELKSNVVEINWSRADSCLNCEGKLTEDENWSGDVALRTDFGRRLALVEIDVLVSQAMHLTLEQLLEIYRIYFPVLQENEMSTWYDQRGRIVWTCSKGLPGVGYLNEKGKCPGRKEWEYILESNPAELVCTATDDTMPDGPKTVERRFVGPFFKCDRVEDYKRAWAHFEKLEQEGAA